MNPPLGLELTTGSEGLRAVIHRSWCNELLECLLRQPIREIELNQAKGWQGSDLDFLRAFPDLRVVEVVDLNIDNVEGIHALRDLTSLVLLTYSRTPLRFEAFPVLRDCDFDWGRRRVTGLGECSHLRHLSVVRMPSEDLKGLSRLTGLKSLWIGSSPIRSLDGVSTLLALTELHLRGLRKLEALDGVECLSMLEYLELDTCRRVESIECVRNLGHLRSLYVNNCGPIESLSPIANLLELEEVLFFESTNVVDGDLAPLTRLPRLRNLSFQNRRHYSHRREQFRAYTESTNV